MRVMAESGRASQVGRGGELVGELDFGRALPPPFVLLV